MLEKLAMKESMMNPNLANKIMDNSDLDRVPDYIKDGGFSKYERVFPRPVQENGLKMNVTVHFLMNAKGEVTDFKFK